MAGQILTDQLICMGGYNLTGVSNAVTIEYGAEMKGSTTFGQSTRSNKGGLFTVQLQAAGFYDAEAQDEPVFAAVGVDNTPITVAASGSSQGDTAYFFAATAGEYSTGETVGELNKYSIGAGAGGTNGKLIRGFVEHNALDTAETSSLIATLGQQLGAVSGSQSLYIALHVVESNGSGDQTLDVDIESDDNSGFTSAISQGSFTQFTTSVGSEILVIPGAILDDYFRAAITIGGTGSPSFKFLISFGVM